MKMNDPKFRSYADIIRWCKRKVATLRTKELSELSRKPPGMPRVNSLRSADDEPDTHPTRNAPKDMSWEGMKKEIVTALRESIGQTDVPPPAASDSCCPTTSKDRRPERHAQQISRREVHV